VTSKRRHCRNGSQDAYSGKDECTLKSALPLLIFFMLAKSYRQVDEKRMDIIVLSVGAF
jgi:hypothetical protein